MSTTFWRRLAPASRSKFRWRKIEEGIANLELVPGRFSGLTKGSRFYVVVDYAHADDAHAQSDRDGARTESRADASSRFLARAESATARRVR